MATGDFWNTDNPKRVWGPMDPDDVLTIPFEFDEWLEGQETTYFSHNLSPAAGLIAVDITVSNGTILVQVSKDPDEVLSNGRKYGVTCQLVAADGQKKSKTLYLKIGDA